MAKIERTKNASRNIFFGVILRFYQIIVQFLMRTAMIYIMGVQYLGLNSLFTSILQVLNLAELGVGSAMVYSMYKPIAEDDHTTICALMKLYKRYYSIIGLVIASVGILLTPFVPNLINGEVPHGINIYILYLLNLGATVLTYWLFAYKNAILQAHQRTDIVSKVMLATSTIQYAVQIVVLLLFHNYYYYVLVMLASQAMANIVTAVCADKLYPCYKPTGDVGKDKVSEINHRILDLFTSKVGGIIYDSADTIVISAFLGLTILAVYQNYFFILSAITGFLTVLFSACTAGIGNSIVIETVDKNYDDFKKFTFIICWIAGFCSCCLLSLYQPFMELWVGKDLMLNFSAVVCFVIYFFVRQINALLNLYKDASGMWHDDKFRPLAAALCNLVLNLILVRYIGIYGVILSTVIAILLVGEPWLLYNLFTVIFDRKYLKEYIQRLLFFCMVVVLSCVFSYLICSFIHATLVTTIILRLLICTIVSNMTYFAFYRGISEYNQSLLLVNSMTRGRLSKVLRKIGMRS